MRKRRPTVITKSDDVEVGAAGSQRAPFRGIDLSRRDEETLKSLKQEWKSLSYHMLGTPRGKALSVIITALLLVGAFTLTLMTTQPDHAYNDGVFDHKSFSSCLWFAWGCFFDPGTHTALPHDENLYTKTVAVVFSIFGFLYNCVVLGIVVDGVRGFLELQNKVHSHVEAQRHILVLGWSDKTLFLVRELFQMLDASRDGGTIVILGEVDEMDMLSDLRVAFPTEVRPPKVSLIVRRGFPCELDDLERVAVEQAHSTIILAAKSLEAGDRATLETVLAIQGLPAMSGSVVCEVCMERSLSVLSRVAGPESLLVLTNSRVDKALAVTAFLPSLGTTLAQLMTFEDDDFYIREFKELNGQTFGSILEQFDEKVMVVGICQDYLTADGVESSRNTRSGGEKPTKRTILSPPDDYVIQSNDKMLLLMSDASSETLTTRSAKGQFTSREQRLKHNKRILHRQKKKEDALAIEASVTQASTKGCSDEESRLLLQDKNSMSNEELDSGGEGGQVHNNVTSQNDTEINKNFKKINRSLLEPKTIALLGWRSPECMVGLLRNIDALACKGSKVILMNELSVDSRTEELQSTGTLIFEETRPHESDKTADCLKNIMIEHVVGSPTKKEDLKELKLKDLDSVVLLARDERNSEEPGDWGHAQKSADAASITAAVLLDEVRVDQCGNSFIGPIVVVEFLAYATERALRGIDLFGTMPNTIAFHSNEMETGIIAIAAQPQDQGALVEKIIMRMLNVKTGPDDLSMSNYGETPMNRAIKKEGSGQARLGLSLDQEIHFSGLAEAEIELYVRADELLNAKISFWGMQMRCRRHGHMLIGWRRVGDRRPTVNTKNKSMGLTWQSGDILLVVRHCTFLI